MHMKNTSPQRSPVLENATVDAGTVERSRQAGGVRIAARILSEGGIERAVGAQANIECALDALLGQDPIKGHLAGDQGCRADRKAVARSRYEAGIRLRRLFVDAGLVPTKAQDYQPRIAGSGAGAELSEKQEAARHGFNRIMQRLGQWGEIPAGPCCYDLNPDNDRWRSNVRRALPLRSVRGPEPEGRPGVRVYLITITLSGSGPFMPRLQKLAPYVKDVLDKACKRNVVRAFSSKDGGVISFMAATDLKAYQLRARLESPPIGSPASPQQVPSWRCDGLH
jgi:hypothetical protein